MLNCQLGGESQALYTLINRLCKKGSDEGKKCRVTVCIGDRLLKFWKEDMLRPDYFGDFYVSGQDDVMVVNREKLKDITAIHVQAQDPEEEEKPFNPNDRIGDGK